MIAAQALHLISQCIEEGRYRLSRHFEERMDERGLFWGDILTAIEAPRLVRGDGYDVNGHDRWIIHGNTANDDSVALVCTLQLDDAGNFLLLVTLFTRLEP